MFCTHCKAVFDWVNLKILDGPVHNPHYFEYLASLRRTPAPSERDEHLECGVTIFDVTERLSDMLYRFYKQEPARAVIQIGRRCLELGNFYPIQPYSEQTYEDLRIERLFYELDEASWHKKLSFRDAARERHQTFARVHQMLVMAVQDIFQRLHPSLRDFRSCRITESLFTRVLEDYIKELQVLRTYYNRELFKLEQEYKVKRTECLGSDFIVLNVVIPKTIPDTMKQELFGDDA